jgi:hypothetical protein
VVRASVFELAIGPVTTIEDIADKPGISPDLRSRAAAPSARAVAARTAGRLTPRACPQAWCPRPGRSASTPGSRTPPMTVSISGGSRHRVADARLRTCNFQHQRRNIQGKCRGLLWAARVMTFTSSSYRNFLR